MGTKALQRLGLTIGAREQLNQSEQELYETFIRDAKNRMGAMQARLSSSLPVYSKVMRRMVDAEIVGRVKTLNTLADKLERTPQEKLPSIHDVAGVRIVAPISMVEQQAFAEALCKEFDDFLQCSRPAKLIDRLRSPSHGYRAIHVIVWPEGNPIEIQIRTSLQHAWAQLMEVLGDRWGRELRYGLPLPPGAEADNGYRAQAVEDMKALSTQIGAYEMSASVLALAEIDVSDEALIRGGISQEQLAMARAEAVKQEAPLKAAQTQLHGLLRSFSENLLNEQGEGA
jgi:ppGpp synthetase/RelA/SpoT-type nucleotidyltranferase